MYVAASPFQWTFTRNDRNAFIGQALHKNHYCRCRLRLLTEYVTVIPNHSTKLGPDLEHPADVDAKLIKLCRNS
jgi:hypothetical protein